MKRRSTIACLLGAITFLPSLATAQTALGDQFQINQFTTSSQYHTQIAASPNGGFVVVWQSYGSLGNDDQDRSIQARLLASDGSFLGSEFQVNSFTSYAQFTPDVGIADNGDFVVTWSSDNETTASPRESTIQARLFASDGTPRGADFQVNTQTFDYQEAPRVAVAGNGDFVIAWMGPDISYSGPYGTDYRTNIQARRFASDGTGQGSEFRVNSNTSSSPEDPTVSMAGNGDFIVAWNAGEKMAQRFSSNGTPLGANFQLNDSPVGFSPYITLEAADNGDFVAAWEDLTFSRQGTSTGSIQARLFSSDGTPLGAQFQVNSLPGDTLSVLEIGVADDGKFAISWQNSTAPDPNDPNFPPRLTDIQGRIFSSDGMPISDELEVSTRSIRGATFRGDLSMSPDGGSFVVVWAGNDYQGTDPGYSIEGRFFGPTPTSTPSPTATTPPSPTATATPTISVPAPGTFSWGWVFIFLAGLHTALAATRKRTRPAPKSNHKTEHLQ